MLTVSCQNNQNLSSDKDSSEVSDLSSIQNKFNTEVPAKILTPDKIETSIGTLEFKDGVPSQQTATLVYNHLDFMRGVETFLNGIPAASIEGLRRGMQQAGATKFNQVVILDQLMDSNPLWLTGNTSTVYASIIVDLGKDGPMVIEVPAGSGPGTVNDAFFRFVIDMGAPGPDKGKGGKYLILPPGYEDEVPPGYFVARSTSYVNWVILRGFLHDGKPDAATTMYKEGLKAYPLNAKSSPPQMEFISGSKKTYNTIHANDFSFYEELDEVIQREPISFLEPELRGLFASVGIQKGKSFEPDDRMKALLSDAVRVGNATARAIVFNTREKEASIFEGRHWESGFIGGDYRWLKDGANGGIFLDARTRFFYTATVNTPAMVMKMVGKGSQYAISFRDSEGRIFDGSKNYSLIIPPNVPAQEFWSVVMYDPQTRSELQTDQALPSISSKRTPLVANDDGSHTIYFGPTNNAPQDKKANWLQSVPDKGWFIIFRLYGPLQPWFDQSWKPNDVELITN